MELSAPHEPVVGLGQTPPVPAGAEASHEPLGLGHEAEGWAHSPPLPGAGAEADGLGHEPAGLVHSPSPPGLVHSPSPSGLVHSPSPSPPGLGHSPPAGLVHSGLGGQLVLVTSAVV